MGWGPVEWVGMVLPEAKFEKKCTSFFEIFWFERPLLRYLLKSVLHWAALLHYLGLLAAVNGKFKDKPEAKFEIKCTSFFYFFWFERPLLRYLLKTVLHCKGSGIWVDAITQVLDDICCTFWVGHDPYFTQEKNGWGWWRIFEEKKLEQKYKNFEAGLIRGRFFVGWKYRPWWENSK